jgi:ABC-type sulfate/molybdate transport systems ATPase subunit
LIIDQPEDDLDNKVIMQIVRLLQTAKRKRQLIFATHNANFLVNGDADKVVALMPGVYDPSGAPVANADTPRISVEVDGAIETPNVQNIITDTVEGEGQRFSSGVANISSGIELTCGHSGLKGAGWPTQLNHHK